ncbi:next to BRCA1 gene 1 protein-like isoform X2 [Scleropages formosus]|uniref:NBR1 autophagy cargo receptor a n=1 Tax=Scleropages formosus TaxID=113540 RepID=A0A8C9RK96_SCLFO|nr:next to BRCA1 gene 1 protein isoform X2 [Scleropages formosus]
MELPVNVKVNFRGNAESFLVSDWKRWSWESMEATIKMAFSLSSLQLKYLDEEKEEVSINSQEEFLEALKCAVKQGHQLTMNVYKAKGAADRPLKAKGKDVRSGLRTAPPYHALPSMVKTVDRETQAPNLEQDGVPSKETQVSKEDEKSPPSWFTSYMEKFKDQVVKEAVEMICREFSGQCCVHQLPHLSSSAPPWPGAVTSSPTCSRCQCQVTGGGYQCSICTCYSLCEKCSLAHDPGHSLPRAMTPLSIPEYGVPGERHRFQKQGERGSRKADKHKLKAEKRQLKAEVKEIRKQLRMEKRGMQQSAMLDRTPPAVLLVPRSAQSPSLKGPKTTCPTGVPTMTALFLDENLPDGTRMQPGTQFVKYWKMRNTGTVCWTTETRLKFMWGNLPLASREKQKEVAVPFLQPGQVGVVSVTFVAPIMEGTYTSHWRLAHRGEQFGPRVWCSMVVDPDTGQSQEKVHGGNCVPMPDSPEREYLIPSVDLLTAQDLLSFELLDINIVQELEKVPHNSPADTTPCTSPLPQDCSVLERRNLSLIQEESEVPEERSSLGVTVEPPKHQTGLHAQEEGEDDISGTQFVCETVIRSLTLEEAPDHKPLRRTLTGSTKAPEQRPCSVEVPQKLSDALLHSELKFLLHRPASPEVSAPRGGSQSEAEDEDEDEGERDEVRSQASSASSEDYVVILPDCFDTSRPLGESMYSSAMSQPARESDGPGHMAGGLSGRSTPEGQPEDTALVPRNASLAPDVTPLAVVPLRTAGPKVPSSAALGNRSEAAGEGTAPDVLHQGRDPQDRPRPVFNGPAPSQGPSGPSETPKSPDLRAHGSIAGGLVKGALSVAASAYKALFTGQQGPPLSPADSTNQDITMMAVLLEMGFGDRQLNQRLLRKHNHNLLEVVNELVQMADNEWYATRY